MADIKNIYKGLLALNDSTDTILRVGDSGAAGGVRITRSGGTASVRIDSSSDSHFLEYMATKVNIGGLNSRASSSVNTGLFNVNAFGDGTLMMKLIGNDNESRKLEVTLASVGPIFTLTHTGGTAWSINGSAKHSLGISGGSQQHDAFGGWNIFGPSTADFVTLRQNAGNTTGLIRHYMANSTGAKYYEVDVDFTANVVKHQIDLGSGNAVPFEISALGNTTFNRPVTILTSSGAMLDIKDGGAFGSSADPHIIFSDGGGFTGATIGYTNSAQSNFRIQSNHGNIIFNLNGSDVGAWQAADNALVVGDASYNGYKLSVKRATAATTVAGASTVGLHNTDTTVNNMSTIAFVNASTASVAGIDGVNVNHNTTSTASGDLVFWTRNAGSLNERVRIYAAGQTSFGYAPAVRKGSDFTSIASAHSGTTVFPSTQGYYRVVGSTAMSVHGIAAGIDGQILRIWNNSGQNMTIAHQSGTEATATNRIITNTGADVSTTGDGFAELIYDITAARWVLMYVSP